MSLGALRYYDANIPCLAACPVNTNAGAYVAAIADGDDLAAYLTARLPNPFASVCGRVCAAPCEDACRRGVVDEPIAIRALKRFVTERYGVESPDRGRTASLLFDPFVDRDRSIGIVGGGPAGLAAAHDLCRLGYRVTLYEATRTLGGMMVLGIPEYRLDRRLVEAEIAAIIGLGIDVELGTRLGPDITLDDLRVRHDGVVLALGATLGRGLDIPGADADGVLRAIEFLINVNQGFRVSIGERVVVVGGGNVAMDAARTALRAAAYGYDAVGSGEPAGDGGRDLTEAVDVARTAVRAGATAVTIVSLESATEMPAAAFEIEEAKLEGVRFVHRRGPHRIETAAGSVTGLTTVGVTSVFDESGHFAPRFDFDDVATLEADTVILAVGQSVDVAAMGAGGPQVSPRGTIAADPLTMATSLPGVYAVGDAAWGPRNLIDAVADGRRVAAALHRRLGGAAASPAGGVMTPQVGFHRLLDRYDRIPRQGVPTLPTERRIGLREVELGFTEDQARREAERCLRCFANVQFDVGACVLCGLCVDVCPTNVLSIVAAADLPFEAAGTALLLDETGCIRCALCIERCPTNALSMGVWSGVGSLGLAEAGVGA